MRTKLLTLFWTAAVALAACSKDATTTSHVATDSIKAIIDQPTTRTYLGEDGVTTYWSVGDKVGLYTSSGSHLAFSATTETDAHDVVFRGELSGQTPAYAYYPYANQSGAYTAVELTLAAEQSAESIAAYDIKAANKASKNSDGGVEFTFSGVMTALAVNIDASNTPLAGSALKSVKVQALPATEGGATPAMTGEFTLNLTDGSTTFDGATNDYASLVWATPHALSSGKAQATMFVNPNAIEVGTTLVVTFTTDDGTSATATLTSAKDCQPNTMYEFDMVLSDLADKVIYEGNPLASISFEQSANSGRLLKSSLFQGSSPSAYYTNSTTSYDIDFSYDADQGMWIATIPYLYDFSGLKATFTTVDDDATVYVNGVKQTSGVTENNFNDVITYVVESANGARQSTKVKVQNTGLPVVTIKGTVYSKETDFDEIEGTTTIDIDGTTYTCGLRLRGNSTQAMPKKPYAIKLDKKAEVLGMPKHKRWVLLANWLDRTMLRNDLAFYLAQQTGAWAPRGKHVEVVLNGVHVGNYYLCEQIKMDENRVNIADVDAAGYTTADDVAANVGFLLECDQSADATEIYFKVSSPVPFYVYIKDPGDAVNSTAAYSYIQNYFTTVGTALKNKDWTKLREYIDYQSFVDHWLFTEITENQESKHPKSFYMHKDAGGKLCAGPAWDYDWSTFIPMSYIGDSRYGETSSTAGTIQNKYTMKYTMWYQYLFNDSAFVSLVKERWAALKPQFQTAITYLDQQAAHVKASDVYNHKMWPIEGMIVSAGYSYGFPNHDENYSFDNAITTMRSALVDRIEWLDGEIGNM